MLTALPNSAGERAALEARMRRQYALVTESLRVGALTLDFTRVANPDETLIKMEADAAAAGTA